MEGLHLYFNYDGGVSSTKSKIKVYASTMDIILGNFKIVSIDIRNDGGVVAGPKSTYKTKESIAKLQEKN